MVSTDTRMGWNAAVSPSLNRALFCLVCLCLHAATIAVEDTKTSKPNKELLQRVTAAVARGELDNLKKLVEQDHANVNEKDVYSVSLLHMISIHCNPDIMSYLIDQGAEVDAQLTAVAGHRAGETPLHFATSSKQIECVKLLIERGADIKLAARAGLTPVHIAAGIGHSDILKVFIDSGADINMEANNDYGSMPIHLAATSGDLDSVKMLIDHGAEVSFSIKAFRFFANAYKTPLT